jgi:hypothetical protein
MIDGVSVSEARRRVELYKQLVRRLSGNVEKGKALASSIDESLIPRLARVPRVVADTRQRLTFVQAVLPVLRQLRYVFTRQAVSLSLSVLSHFFLSLEVMKMYDLFFFFFFQILA